MPAVSNLALPDTLVDLDAPPPVEFPLPAPFAHVVNPVNALPFARGEDLVALGIYKFSAPCSRTSTSRTTSTATS